MLLTCASSRDRRILNIATIQNYHKAVKQKHHQNAAKRWCRAPQTSFTSSSGESPCKFTSNFHSQFQHSKQAFPVTVTGHHWAFTQHSIWTFLKATLWDKNQCLDYQGCEGTKNSITCEGQRARMTILDSITGLSDSQWCLRNRKLMETESWLIWT